MRSTFIIAIFFVVTTAGSAQANGPGGISPFCAKVIDRLEINGVQNDGPRGLYIKQLRQQLEGRENKCGRFLVDVNDDVSPHVGQNPGNNKNVGNAPYDGSRGRVPSGRGS